MSRKVMMIVLVALALVAGTSTTLAGGNGATPAVTGEWDNDAGQTLATNVIRHKDGSVSGTLTGSVAGELQFSGDVKDVCVLENEAYATGVITAFPAFPPVVGLGFIIRVTDNGQGKGDPDRTTGVIFLNGVPPHDVLCNPDFQAGLEGFAAANNLLRTVVAGNLKVRN